MNTNRIRTFMLPKYIQENVFHSFCSDILHIGLYIYIGYMGAEEILDQFVATGHRGNVLIYNTYCANLCIYI